MWPLKRRSQKCTEVSIVQVNGRFAIKNVNTGRYLAQNGYFADYEVGKYSETFLNQQSAEWHAEANNWEIK